MLIETSKDKVPKTLADFERETRRFLVSYRRQRAAQEMCSAFATLTLSPDQRSVPLSPEFLETLDPEEHSLRLIPKGPKVRISSYYGQISVQFLRTGKKQIFEAQMEPFSLSAIYSAAEKTFWVTEIQSFRSFNYGKVGFKVGRFLSHSHFPNEVICAFDELTVRRIPEIPFSMALLNELRMAKLSQSRYAEVMSRETGATIRITSPCQFFKKKLTVFFRKQEDQLMTKDGHRIPLQLEDAPGSSGAKLVIPYQRVRLLVLLQRLLETTLRGGMEVEDAEWSVLQGFLKPIDLKKNLRAVLDLSVLSQKVAAVVREVESAVESPSKAKMPNFSSV